MTDNTKYKDPKELEITINDLQRRIKIAENKINTLLAKIDSMLTSNGYYVSDNNSVFNAKLLTIENGFIKSIG